MYLVNFPQTSNSADWIDTIELTSEDDGTPIDLTGCTITLQVWNQTMRGQGTGLQGYWGLNSLMTPLLEASTANGKLTVPDTGVIQWTFRASEMSALQAAFYEVGLIIRKNSDTVQIVIGVLPIVNGVVL